MSRKQIVFSLALPWSDGRSGGDSLRFTVDSISPGERSQPYHAAPRAPVKSLLVCVCVCVYSGTLGRQSTVFIRFSKAPQVGTFSIRALWHLRPPVSPGLASGALCSPQRPQISSTLSQKTPHTCMNPDSHPSSAAYAVWGLGQGAHSLCTSVPLSVSRTQQCSPRGVGGD